KQRVNNQSVNHRAHLVVIKGTDVFKIKLFCKVAYFLFCIYHIVGFRLSTKINGLRLFSGNNFSFTSCGVKNFNLGATRNFALKTSANRVSMSWLFLSIPTVIKMSSVSISLLRSS